MAKKKDTDQSNEEMKIVYRRLDTIKPLPGNAKLHDLPGIIKGISDHGFVDPVLVSIRTMHNLDGNGRWEALTQMHSEGRTAPAGVIASGGFWLIPTLDKDCDEQTERILALSLNRLNEKGGYDPAAVLAILNEANEIGRLEQTGYDGDALAGVLARCADLNKNGNGDGTSHAPAIEPADAEPQIDRAVELNKKWKVKSGDIWLIGEHRLLCGDSTKAADVASVMNGHKANIAFTSPPYASQRKYDESSGFVPIQPDAYSDWWEPVQAAIREHLQDDGSFFVNIKEHCEDGQRHLYVKDLTIAHVRRWGWRFIDEFCWKRRGVPGGWDNRFKNEFEPVFHYAKQAQIKFRKFAVGEQSDKVFTVTDRSRTGESVFDCNSDNGKVFQQGLALPGNVVEVNGQTDGAHNAAYPIGLPSFFVKAFTDAEDCVYEPFCGSGTTIVAAENLGRKCYAIEISPAYCAVILERMATAFPDMVIRKA